MAENEDAVDEKDGEGEVDGRVAAPIAEPSFVDSNGGIGAVFAWRGDKGHVVADEVGAEPGSAGRIEIGEGLRGERGETLSKTQFKAQVVESAPRQKAIYPSRVVTEETGVDFCSNCARVLKNFLVVRAAAFLLEEGWDKRGAFDDGGAGEIVSCVCCRLPEGVYCAAVNGQDTHARLSCFGCKC